MNKVNIFLTVSALIIAAFGCGGRGSGGSNAGDNSAQDVIEEVITMTSRARYISFHMEGAGRATIDWGDGSNAETKGLATGLEQYVSRVFTDTINPRQITISGGNITHLRFANRRITRSSGLMTLDASRYTTLTVLLCAGQEIKELNVSSNTALIRLDCSDNQLVELDVSKNPALVELNCADNQFTVAALNELLDALHVNGGLINIANNPGTDGSAPHVAHAKGWTIDGISLAKALEAEVFRWGTFTDARDGQSYRTIAIGEQTWMAENLNFATGTSYCYDNNNAHCQTYGRLYSWGTALQACPEGWRLPDLDDWNALIEAVKIQERHEAAERRQRARGGGFMFYNIAGTVLKSKTGWQWTRIDNQNLILGTDDFGFSALPAGMRNRDGIFGGMGELGSWWTANEDAEWTAHHMHMSHDVEFFNESYANKASGYSVRCIKCEEIDN